MWGCCGGEVISICHRNDFSVPIYLNCFYQLSPKIIFLKIFLFFFIFLKFRFYL